MLLIPSFHYHCYHVLYLNFLEQLNLILIALRSFTQVITVCVVYYVVLVDRKFSKGGTYKKNRYISEKYWLKLQKICIVFCIVF